MSDDAKLTPRQRFARERDRALRERFEHALGPHWRNALEASARQRGAGLAHPLHGRSKP